ncbi:MAG: DUF4832 domain-containing protein, partial [Aliifodinibius sp.]|nr:DUF4832 domain-containing protein [candidate division Zixibacteria bacterium]NIT55275.1 DUF4832 domain-containing protein [Fodinibius sp.]NIS46946.1 DUF4832 domain-containing protein [candidate division Zixibacteria bacterium]NIU15093.1 DUF4832 domain-containing protein [candidate division Zixibacteria bacterium]NIV07139.1 DUF4832 domain-containing protein [candidate division Zixibacteria bacterium]
GCNNALKDLERMRWSVINKDYHPVVLQGWINNGCMDEIKRRLGYRFRLIEATLQDSVRPDGAFQMSFSMVNDGWASPYNPRNLEVLLRNSQDDEVYYLLADEDPRMWMAGDTANVSVEAGIPAVMPTGSYEILLHFADPVPALHDRPEYSFRLANPDVWEDSTGYNHLLHNIVVDPNAPGSNYTGNHYFQLSGGTTMIENNSNPYLRSFDLKGNYPNPFNGKTWIEFDILNRGRVKIDIFDIQGKYLESIFEKVLNPGRYQIPWYPIYLSSGVYIYKLSANGHSESKKLIYVK